MTLNNEIYDDEDTWMQTTVTASAGDKVSFYWRVSSQEYFDELKFYIDDSLQDSISGEKDWQKKSYALSAGSRTLKWVYSKDSDTTEGEDLGWVDGLYVGPSSGSLPLVPPDLLSQALDSDLKFTTRADDDCVWTRVWGSSSDYYYEDDAACSGDSLDDNEESCLQTIVDSDSSQTLKFHWKVSSEENSDYLEFYMSVTCLTLPCSSILLLD